MPNTITAGNATNGGTAISSDTSGVLELKTGSSPTTAIAVDASQNVGIGTSSPNTALSVRRGAGADAYIDIAGNNNTLGSTSFTIGQASDNISYIYQRANAALIFATNNAERARINSSGNLLVGTTSISAGRVNVLAAGGASGIVVQVTNNGDYGLAFNNASGTNVGRIQIDSGSTSYVTSSDYRLKNSIAPMTGALAKVALLKPCTYKWNEDDSDADGFIAHELAEVCPQAVSGKKDAVDAEGNPVYQGIDTSFLVATLTAAIQELKAEIDAIKAEVAALKGA
jgi:hypothetical protein